MAPDSINSKQIITFKFKDGYKRLEFMYGYEPFHEGELEKLIKRKKWDEIESIIMMCKLNDEIESYYDEYEHDNIVFCRNSKKGIYRTKESKSQIWGYNSLVHVMNTEITAKLIITEE
jgi:hypothetical protein